MTTTAVASRQLPVASNDNGNNSYNDSHGHGYPRSRFGLVNSHDYGHGNSHGRGNNYGGWQ